MTSTLTLLERNAQFAEQFRAADLPILPKLRTVLLTCADARVDPAHLFELDLGDAVVIRNTGGRVTQAVIDEVASLAFLVTKMDGDNPGPFELVLVQHTQCGAERFADPQLQQGMKQAIGVDVSAIAITDHEQSLNEDAERLRQTTALPAHILVSGLIYDVKTGRAHQVIAPAPLRR